MEAESRLRHVQQHEEGKLCQTLMHKKAVYFSQFESHMLARKARLSLCIWAGSSTPHTAGK